jgi:copper chaperone NosL
MKNLLMIILVLVATACNQDPQSINYGKENCSFCKMTIMDEKFATECVSTKGKTFKFDDIHCMTEFIKNGGIWSNEIAKIYLSDYSTKGKWIEANKSFLIHSPELKSPMGGNYAAFDSEKQREEFNNQFNGEKISWDQIMPGK